MVIKRLGLIVWLLTICLYEIHSQTIELPGYALKSHETLEILKVEITSEKTVLYMSVENRIDGGNFCADKNIYVIYPDSDKLKLVKSLGIPVCPDAYKFKSIGEKLQFTLDFPPLKTGIKWIDVIEECSENCFSFFGVTLNPDLNTRINKALAVAKEGGTTNAILLYKSILGDLPVEDNGIKGALYTDIITLSLETGDKAGAAEWYKKMLVSDSPRLELYVNNLNSRGIRF